MTPRRLAGVLAFRMAILAVVQGAWLAAGALAMGVSLSAAARLCVLVSIAAAVVAVASVLVVVRRTASLHRAASRAAVAGSMPPSQSALRDALVAPTSIALAVSLPAPLAVSADVASAAHALVGLPAGSELGFALLAVSAGSWALAPAAVTVRRALLPWLAAFRPEDQRLERGRPITPAPGVEVALPLLAAATGGAAVLSAVAPEHHGLLATVAATLAALGAVGLGRWVSRSLAEDVTLLARRVGDAVALLPHSPSGNIDLGSDAYRTEEVSELGAAVESMAARYAGSARHEEKARESVQEIQRKKMMFMASMSHDLRSPLNSILGFSELLSAGGSGLNEAQRESVRLIRRSGEELLRLLEDVLDSARFEAGRLPLTREWTPSVEILTQAVARGRQVIADRDLSIVAELQPGLPPVHVDRRRIVQSVVCLFRHAARAMERGTIRMYARVAPDPQSGVDRLRVDVVDPSGGIREEDRERIFEAFREVTATTGRRVGGLGLSLSLARSLVRAHGGDVWIGKGSGTSSTETTFTVALPIGEE